MKALRFASVLAVGATLLLGAATGGSAKQTLGHSFSWGMKTLGAESFTCNGTGGEDGRYTVDITHSCTVTFNLGELATYSKPPTLYLNLHGQVTTQGRAGVSGSVGVEYTGPLNKLHKSTVHLTNLFRPTTTFDTKGIGWDAQGYALISRSDYVSMPNAKVFDKLTLRLFSTSSSLLFRFGQGDLLLAWLAPQ